VKYGPPGQEILVTLSSAGRAVRVTVDDQGPGIPSDAKERIWEPFQRLDRDANSGVAGSGIGLSVVRELAVLHGGRAWFEPIEGGSRFVIELPLAMAAAG
jgi:signal transduction histidine kinase